MSHAAIVDAFPRRPIRLTPDPARARAGRLWLIGLLLALLPGLWLGWSLWQTGQLRGELRANGVETEVLSAEGSCVSRRQITGDNPRGCNFEIEYVVRDEHGGGTRRADVRLDGARPIFTPPALYDPADPDRVMLKPEAERDARWTEWIGVPLMLAIPLAGLVLLFLARKDPLEAAAADPRPTTVPVDRFARRGNALQAWSRKAPGEAKEWLQVFNGQDEPFLLRAPEGSADDRPWALALLHPKGRPILLDRELKRLELTDEERARLLGG